MGFFTNLIKDLVEGVGLDIQVEGGNDVAHNQEAREEALGVWEAKAAYYLEEEDTTPSGESAPGNR
jgi:hypothetical protein